MSIKKTFSLLLAVCVLYQSAAQQKTWTLEDCIRHALENNIQIKQQSLQTMYQTNALDLAKFRLLPTVSGSASHSYSFGRALDQTTYQFTESEKIVSDNFYLGGTFVLFNGFQNLNSIKKSAYELRAGGEDLRSMKDNVALSVAIAYLQILLNKEIVNATGNQVEISRQQIDKSRKLVEAGSIARGNLLQIEAQAAQEELQLINMRNQLDISFLNLAQLLELKSPEGFLVTVPPIEIDSGFILEGSVADIYNVAVNNRPEIKSAELKLTASEYDLKIARGGRSPRLAMNHSFSTGYSDIRKKLLGVDPLTGPEYGKYPFFEQLNDNINYGIAFNLNVPILNGWQVNKGISNSKLTIENNRFALDAAMKQLYKNIQQAYADAGAALKKYNASLRAVSSAEESFRYSEQRFNVGLVTPVDYNASKTQLLRAQSELAQSKYEFVFKIKVLDFYKGIPISLPK